MEKFQVATKAIIRGQDNKYLVLCKSHLEDINPNEIDIPGGRLKFGEDATDGLKREIKEELGLEVEILKPLRVWNLVKDDMHLVGITFLASYSGGQIILSEEHCNFNWVSKEEILNGSYPKWIKKEFDNLD